MTVEINPTWDRTGRLTVSVSEDPARLEVSEETGSLCRYELRATRPDRLGWVQSSPRRGGVTVADVLAHCLREWEAEQLVLELTESAVMRDIVTATHRLDALKALGVRIAVDDFGEGHSSLAYLASLPLDLL